MNIVQVQKLFEPFGVDKREVRLYTAALSLGEASMTQLAEKSKISRTTCYELYKVLEKRGWMGSYKTSAGLRYVATRPKIVLQNLENLITETNKTLPYLNALINTGIKKPIVKHLKGFDGFAAAVAPSIETPGNTVLHFGSLDVTNKIFPVTYDHRYYMKKRIANNVILKCLYVDGMATNIQGRNHAAEKRVIRYLPATYPCEGTKVMWDNTVVSAVKVRHEIITTVVEHPVIAEMEKSQFEWLWDFVGKG